MDTKDLPSVTQGSKVLLNDSFESPFLGESIESLKKWYRNSMEDPKTAAFTDDSFIILDEKSAETKTCIVVALDEPALETIRVDFILALSVAQAVNCEDCGFTWRYVEKFEKNGGVLTNDNLKIAQDNGLYIAEGEVQKDDNWYTPNGDGIPREESLRPLLPQRLRGSKYIPPETAPHLAALRRRHLRREAASQSVV